MQIAQSDYRAVDARIAILGVKGDIEVLYILHVAYGI